MSCRSIIVLAALCVTVSAAAAARADVCLSMADSLAGAGFPDAAITEYKRFIYFNGDDPRIDRCLVAIAKSHRELGDLEAALETTRSAVEAAGTDGVRDMRRLDAAELLIEKGEISSAELESSRVLAFSRDPRVRRRAALLVAECHLRSGRWKDLAGVLSLGGVSDGLAETGVDSVLSDLESLELKSPELAMSLSTFLPGAGQIYAGDALDGLHSLAVNGLFAALCVSAVAEASVGDAIVGLSMFRRYYLGNRMNAAVRVEEHNSRMVGPRLEALREQIQRMKSGRGD